MTKKSHLKAKIDLYNITANLSYKDYIQANFKNGKKKSKKHIPYSLSDDTLQAKELYDLVFCTKAEDITLEQEELLKFHLLNYRLNRTELLEDRGGKNYFKNSIMELNMVQ